MFKLELPKTIRILIALYYHLGIWSDQSTYRERSRRYFLFIFALAYLSAVALRAKVTSDPDERIFLVVVSVQFAVQGYRFWLILWRKNEILSVLHQFGTRYTDEQSEFYKTRNLLVLDEFGTHFGTLFLLQVGTGSVCICGAVYTLAFSSHEDLIIDAINCIVLLYSLFDIFMVMYLANEIKLSSDDLSRCLYNSNWIEQTQSCKRCVIILGERFKQPQELVVGKIYPLNLLTFTSIINGAYSMFNILQNLRE
ncbi:odorant receptor 43a-like [Bradysia coprophila]|uniref:odorant receptor 43a-like n=1 Tax=Bradysia coprophila TaxID=38358 RepID=UPI00187D84F7|nr:odorant receptor 43a-like [Bradysia coprophila]